jgi:hypothetical protein
MQIQGLRDTSGHTLPLWLACLSRIFRSIKMTNIQKVYKAKNTRMQRTQETNLNQEAKKTNDINQ